MTSKNARSTDIFDLLADVMRARQEPWRDRAACKGTAFDTRGRPTSLFFPKEAAAGQDAQAMCQVCPVRLECEADHHRQPPASQHYGVWYGTTATEREQARRAQRESSAKSLTVAA